MAEAIIEGQAALAEAEGKDVEEVAEIPAEEVAEVVAEAVAEETVAQEAETKTEEA